MPEPDRSPPPDPPTPEVEPRPAFDSVTDAGGTVARFEMAYSPPPKGRVNFGAPIRVKLPAYLYLAASLVVAAIAIAGYRGPTGSALHRWIVEGDRGRPMSAGVLAAIVVLSALATLVRAHMRGVIIHADGVEARYVLPLGIPRVRRWAWPQIHRVVVSSRGLALELWDGGYEKLPEVAEPERLGNLLGSIAAGRGIQVTRVT